MRTIAFVSHRYIDNYDFDLLASSSDRLIAFVLAPFIDQFPENKKHYFHAIIPIPMPLKKTGPLIRFDYDALKSAIESVMKQYACDNNFWLMCVDEVNMCLTARLREEFNLPGITENEALLFQNKVVMKHRLSNTNIPIPRYETFYADEAKSNSDAYYQALTARLGKKFVLKPASYTGSFGVAIIADFDHFQAFVNSNIAESHEYEAETFIEGDLYHCDIVMQNDTILFSECCLYTCPNNDFSKGNVIASLILPENAPLKSSLSTRAIEAVKALGARNGVFHVELFVTENDIYFLEVAARPAGGLVAKMYEKMFDINLFTLDMGVHLNMKLPEIKRNHTTCLQALVPINQHVIDGFNKIPFQSETTVEWLVSKEDIAKRDSHSVVDIAAKALFHSNHYEDIQHDFYKLKTLGKEANRV